MHLIESVFRGCKCANILNAGKNALRYTYICNHLQLSVLNCYYESEVSRLHHSCLTFVQVYFALHIKVNAVSLNHDLFTLQHETRKLQQSTHLRDVLCGSWASTSKLMLQ